MSTTAAGAAPGRSFPELCLNAARVDGSRAAVVDDRGRQLSYDTLVADAAALARGLRSIGVGAGETVGLLAPNSTDWVVSALGCHLAGAVVAAFHTWVKPHDLDFLLRHSEVSTLIVAPDVGGRDLQSPLASLAPSLAGEDPDTWRSERYPALRRVVVTGDAPLRGARRWASVLEAGRALPDLPAAEPVGAADVAFVLYTSGSTADPKGVPLLHGDMVDNGYWIGERMGLGPHDKVWLGSPLFWSFGSANAMIAAFSHRATLVLQEKFDAESAAAQIAEQRCTAAYLLPVLAHAFADVVGIREAFV
ncbi:MAG: AMP-binding protein, partial [Acidimicrobiales bacterium]